MSDLSFLKEIPDPLAGAAPATGPEAPPRPVEASPLRRTLRRRRSAAFALGVLWLCTHLAVYGVRQDLQRLSARYVVAQIVLPALLGAGSLLLALAPGKLGLGPPASRVAALAVLGPLSFWLFAAGMPVPYAAHAGAAFWPGSLVCLDITLAWAAALLLLAAWTLRRAFPAGARWRSALVGGALGLACGATIQLHCANVQPGHLVAGHGVPILVSALVGGFLLSRWARA